MSQAHRERVASVIHTWSDGAGLMRKLPAESQKMDERPIGALLARLQAQTTMAQLAEAYLAAGSAWPSGLPALIPEQRSRQGVIVATAHWLRYQQLLVKVTDRAAAPGAGSPDSPAAMSRRELGPEFGHLEMVYTVKLWQRGPLRLRALSPDRRVRYESLVRAVAARLADCRSVRELAARYYGDGDWILELAREELLPKGEPLSSVSWAQDAACWRRYQELLEASPIRHQPEGAPPTFAIWLAGQMSRRRLSVAELARRLGTIEGVVRSWLHAVDLPGAEQARCLAAAFGVPESQMPCVGSAAR